MKNRLVPDWKLILQNRVWSTLWNLLNAMMKNEMLSQKTYYLNKSMRFLMIGCGLLVWIIPIIPFMAGATNLGSTKDMFVLLGFVICLSLPCLIYAFSCRLVTTPKGIKNYSYFPFKSFIAWEDTLRVEKGELGWIYLIASPQGNRKTNRIIGVSTFIESWSDSELIEDIQTYAPHVLIPDDLRVLKEIHFIYKTTTLLMYFAFSMLWVLITFFFNFDGEVKKTIGFVTLGGLLASLGGMSELLWYGEWRDAQVDKQKIKKLIFVFYTLPFWGMFMAFFLYLILNLVPVFGENIRNISVIFCFLQFRILLKVFGKYLFSEQPTKES